MLIILAILLLTHLSWVDNMNTGNPGDLLDGRVSSDGNFTYQQVNGIPSCAVRWGASGVEFSYSADNYCTFNLNTLDGIPVTPDLTQGFTSIIDYKLYTRADFAVCTHKCFTAATDSADVTTFTLDGDDPVPLDWFLSGPRIIRITTRTVTGTIGSTEVVGVWVTVDNADAPDGQCAPTSILDIRPVEGTPSSNVHIKHLDHSTIGIGGELERMEIHPGFGETVCVPAELQEIQ